MSDFCDYSYDLPEFDHSPFRGPRQDIGEQAFFQVWQEWMRKPYYDEDDISSLGLEPPNAKFLSLFEQSTTVQMDQRCATVAASVIVWLATNCGRDYLRQADSLWATLSSGGHAATRSQCYLMTMARENERRHLGSHGARLIEILMAPDECWDFNDAGHRLELLYVPEMRSADFDIVEGVVKFLGTGEGQEFIQAAHERWDILKRRERLRGPGYSVERRRARTVTAGA